MLLIGYVPQNINVMTRCVGKMLKANVIVFTHFQLPWC